MDLSAENDNEYSILSIDDGIQPDQICHIYNGFGKIPITIKNYWLCPCCMGTGNEPKQRIAQGSIVLI